MFDAHKLRMCSQVLGSMLDDPATGPGSSRDAAAAEREEGDSYEELVMKRVAAYVQQSQVKKTKIKSNAFEFEF